MAVSTAVSTDFTAINGRKRTFLYGILLGILLCWTFSRTKMESNSLLRTSSPSATLSTVSSSSSSREQGVTSGIFDAVTGNHVHKSVPPIIRGSNIGGYPDYGGCIVSDRLQFIYIKTAKSAGSTILLGWVRPSLCPAKDDEDVFTGFGVKASSRVSKTCDSSTVYPQPGTDNSNCEDIPLWKWEQYFVFSTVRNPYSRMRSAYTYCKQTGEWESFCIDPKATNGCDFHKSKKPGHSNDPHYQFPVHWAYHGWWGWHVDYLIRVEDIDSGVAEVASIVNARAAERGEELRLRGEFKSVNVKQKPAAQEKADLCQWFRGKFQHCAVALEKTMDPYVLGYSDYCSD